jgi:hypothetical protein
MQKAVAVFTGKSASRILREGGTSSWVLDPTRAADCDYVVCTRSYKNWREGTEPKGSAFLVGKVSGVVRSPDRPNRYPYRYLITMSEYALADIPDVWQGWRNPVRYTTMEDLGIDPAQLEFKPMSASSESRQPTSEAAAIPADESHDPLSIEEAKAGLATTFGVAPSQIEIIIRA